MTHINFGSSFFGVINVDLNYSAFGGFDMKRFLMAVAALVFSPAVGTAATVSYYSASALISVTLVSATYGTTGIDAFSLGAWQDEVDSLDDQDGTGTYSASDDNLSGWPRYLSYPPKIGQ